MDNIKAPFNFVPVSDEVFYPDWAELVTHDIPLKDSVSGSLEITITARTPIYIRNGHSRTDAESTNDIYKKFSSIKDKNFIPASTIRGLLRNTLKMISLGRMDNVEDNRYSIRDINNKQDYMKYFSYEGIKCGWLSKEGHKLIIEDCGIPDRISLEQIDEEFGTNLAYIYSNKNNLRNAFDKIDILRKKVGKYPIPITYDTRRLDPKNPVDKRILATNINSGSRSGKIVVTGHPSPRNIVNKTGKWYEFVFPCNEVCTKYEFDEEDQIFRDFLFINNDSDDWKKWSKKLKDREKVPVFFHAVEDKIKHFGLAYMYKLPYTYKVRDFLSDAHKNEKKLDLADLIFGHTCDNSLKSRVFILSAFETEKSKTLEERELYLSSPKASYYPIYLEQKGEDGNINGKPYTMMDKDSKLRGWKKYPVRENIGIQATIMGQQTNMTKFIPLDTGSRFKCKLLYHNLKKEELGALIRTISFPEYHSIGMGKPFGYGKIKVEISDSKQEYKDYENEFKKCIQEYITEKKGYDRILNEFRLMSEDHELKNNSLEYMELKDFQNARKNSLYLMNYSELIKKPENIIVKKVYTATVTFVSGKLVKAKLENQKDTVSKVMIVDDIKIKLKEKDVVSVSIIETGVNKGNLYFIGKL